MESTEPVRAKRGCLWYIGVAVAGTFGLLVLLVAAFIFSPDEPSQHSIVVSGDDHTYLEAVIEQHRKNGEGFLADYVNETVVYYIHVGGWFRDTRRVPVDEGGIAWPLPSEIGFRRFLDHNGRLQIEIKQRVMASQDSIVLVTFVPPASFPDN